MSADIEIQITQAMRAVSNALGGSDEFAELLVELPDSALRAEPAARLAAWERMRRAAVRGETDVEALARLATPVGDAGIPSESPCHSEQAG